MSFSQVLDSFLQGELSDAELGQQIQGWQAALEARYTQLEEAGETAALEGLEQCADLLEQFHTALTNEDYDTLEELAKPTGSALEASLQQAVAEPAEGPPELRRLFAQLDLLLEGGQAKGLKAALEAVSRAAEPVRQAAASPGIDERLQILREAAAHFDDGLHLLEAAGAKPDAQSIETGKERLKAAYAKVLELKID